MVGPAVKREGVAHLRATMGLSERRACSIVSADRKMVRYRSCRPPDTELRTQLRDLANERKRFGYRRLFVLLRQEGEPSGINRIGTVLNFVCGLGTMGREELSHGPTQGSQDPGCYS